MKEITNEQKKKIEELQRVINHAIMEIGTLTDILDGMRTSTIIALAEEDIEKLQIELDGFSDEILKDCPNFCKLFDLHN